MQRCSVRVNVVLQRAYPYAMSRHHELSQEELLWAARETAISLQNGSPACHAAREIMLIAGVCVVTMRSTGQSANEDGGDGVRLCYIDGRLGWWLAGDCCKVWLATSSLSFGSSEAGWGYHWLLCRHTNSPVPSQLPRHSYPQSISS
jgi:hypothetical protein